MSLLGLAITPGRTDPSSGGAPREVGDTVRELIGLVDRDRDGTLDKDESAAL